MAFPNPSLTAPTLTSWQFSYQGLTFGAGQPIAVKRVQGMGDLATIASGDVARSRDQGELIGLDLYRGRDVTIDLEAESSAGSVQSTLLTLAAATQVGGVTEHPLWFQVPGYPLLCVMARPRKRSTPWDVGYQIGSLGVVSVQFHCVDPRIYSVGHTSTVGLPSPTAGMTFPVTFPISFGASTPSGMTVTNAGNTEVRPVLVITGPVTNPSVQNSTLAGSPKLSFVNPNQSGYTVAAGDQLVIDTDLHTVLYYVGGVASGSVPASRGSWLDSGSTWWDLPPGANLVQFLSQDTVAVAGTCAIQWSDGYSL